ncbi:MAG: acyltransferase family protein [Caulobacterales bacterium]|nr:acyltransferase family protein [Caulobacterales bacterium]
MSLLTWQRGASPRRALPIGDAQPAAANAGRPAAVSVAGSPDPRPSGARRADLDWIRVCAFGLLILYHVALVYSPFDWHIHSAYTFGWMREALLVTQPWRLTLLFLVSGSALRFMASGKAAGAVLGARVARLGPPLLFGVVALVPVQAWIEATDKGAWAGGLGGWMARQFSPQGLAEGVPVNHLWFVVYIAVYTLAAAPLLASPALTARLEAGLERALGGWRLMVLPALYLIVARAWLYYYCGLTNALVGDWYNHAQSLAAFLFGFLLARREPVWRDLERFRWVGLGVAAVALPLAMLQSAHPGGGAFHEIPRNSVYALDQWAAIVAILGFASRHLRHASSSRLRYLNEAVFPCYLAHQTVLVLAVWLIRPAQLPAPAEALFLVAVTFAGSLLVYEAVRRAPPLRPLWGLKPAAAGR